MLRGLFVATGMALLAMAAPAAAQDYPPPVNSLTCDDTTPDPGQTISCTARTFAGGAAVTFTFESQPVNIASGTADANGVVTVDATIPANASEGAHTLTAEGTAPDGSSLAVSLTLQVTGDDDNQGDDDDQGGALPRTGDDSSLPLARVGLALAALGGVILAVSAKRRRSTAAT